jgi:hypothetical protein
LCQTLLLTTLLSLVVVVRLAEVAVLEGTGLPQEQVVVAHRQKPLCHCVSVLHIP